MTDKKLFEELLRLQNEMTAVLIQLNGRRKTCHTCTFSTEFVGYCTKKGRDVVSTKTCGTWREEQ